MLKSSKKFTIRAIVILGLISIANSVYAMDSGELIVVSLKDLAKKEAHRNFYYPDVPAAQDKANGCAIADYYFTVQLPTKKIARIIPFQDACKYWTWAGNMPEAAKVIPEIKEFTKEVMIRAFVLRKSMLGNQFIDKELFQAVEEVNQKITLDPQQLKKWQELAPIIESFKHTPVESRQGYLGHDV